MKDIWFCLAVTSILHKLLNLMGTDDEALRRRAGARLSVRIGTDQRILT